MEKEDTMFGIKTSEFAEFYGVMLGDGCVYANLSGICIAGHNVLDENYHTVRLKALIFFLFGLQPKTYYSKDQKLIRTVVYSQKIAQLFIALGFPKGLKNNGVLTIPEFFFSDTELLRSCLKGLYDTDGTIYHHNGAKSIVEISITDPMLIKSSHDAAHTLGLNFKTSTKRIYISGRDNVIDFYNEVRPANMRHTLKYEYLLEGDKIPTSKEIENYLKGFQNSEPIRASDLVAMSV